MPAFRFFTALSLAAGLAGCDAILSHPSIPSEAKAIAYEGLDQVASLRPEVDQFLGGFRLESRESAAVSQMAGAMFMVLEARDMGGVVRGAVEIKRAQLCLAKVGVDASGVVQDLQAILFKDERARELWMKVVEYLGGEDAPLIGGLVCNPLGAS